LVCEVTSENVTVPVDAPPPETNATVLLGLGAYVGFVVVVEKVTVGWVPFVMVMVVMGDVTCW